MPNRFQDRVVVDPNRGSAPVSLGVAASPTSTPVLSQTNSALQLADALKGFSPGLGNFGAKYGAEKAKADSVAGALAAENAGAANFADAKKAIPPEASPEFQDSYMQRIGEKYGRDYARQLSQAATTDYNPDLETPQDFIKRQQDSAVQGIDDKAFLTGFYSIANPTNESFLNKAQGEQAKQIQSNIVGMLNDQINSVLDAPAHDRNPSWLDELKFKFGADFSVSKAEVEQAAFSTAATRAVIEGKPEFLDAFYQRTGDGREPYCSIHSDKCMEIRDKALAQRAKGNRYVSDLDKFNARVQFESTIAQAKQNDQPIDETAALSKLRGLVKNNVLDPGAATTYYRAVKAQNTYVAELNRTMDQFMSGQGAGLPKDELSQKAFEKGFNQLMQSTPDPQENTRRAVAYSIQNGRIPTGVQQAVVQGLTAIPAKDGAAPDEFKQGAAFFHQFWSQDQNSVYRFFDAKTIHQYETYFNLMSGAFAGNPDAAYRASVFLQTDQAKKTKDALDMRSVRDAVNSASSALTPSSMNPLNWFGSGPSVTPYVSNKVMGDTLDLLASSNGQMTPDQAAKQAVKAFQANHQFIGNSWVNISALPRPLSQDELKMTGEALDTLKLHWAHEVGLSEADAKDATVSLVATPRTFSSAGGGSEFNVVINGMPTGRTIQPFNALQQYARRADITPERVKELQDTVSQINSFDPTKVPMTDTLQQKLSSTLDYGRDVGLLTPDQYSRARQRLLDNAQHSEVWQNSKLLNEPYGPLVEKLRIAPTPDEVAAEHLIPAIDRAATHPFQTAFDAAEPDPTLALAAALNGYSGTAFPDNGKVYIGFGYNMSRPEKELKADFQRAGIVSGDNADKTIKALVDGKLRLSERQAASLVRIEASRAMKTAQDVVGQEVWNSAHSNVKASFIALAMRAGSKQRFSSALDAIKADDWQTAMGKLDLIGNDKALMQKRAAAILKSMSNSVYDFKAIMRNNSQ